MGSTRDQMAFATFGLSEVPSMFKSIKGTVKDMFAGPEIPDAPTPDAPVVAGDEGVRRGEMMKQSKRRAIGQAYLTRGQDRSSGTTLGGLAQTLG